MAPFGCCLGCSRAFVFRCFARKGERLWFWLSPVRSPLQAVGYRPPFFAAFAFGAAAFAFGAVLVALAFGAAAFAFGAVLVALVFFGAVAGFAVAPLGFASGSGAASCFGAVSTFGGVGGGSAISVVALVTGAAGGELGAGALGAMGAGRGAVDKRSCCGPWCVMCSRSRHRNTIPRSTAASVSCTPVCLTCSCCRRWYS